MKFAVVLKILTLVFILTCSVASNAAQITFSPRVTVSEEYTDNLYLTRDNREEDFITTVRPGFTLSFAGRNSLAALSYDPSYSWYAENPENDTLRHSARWTSWQDVSRNTRLFLNDTFIYTEEPYQQGDTVDRNGRDPYYTNTAGVGMNHRFGREDTVSVALNHRLLRNQDDAYEDSESLNPTLNFAYWMTPRYGLEGGLSYNRGTFEESDDFNNYRGNLRLTQRFSRHLSIFLAYDQTVMRYDEIDDNDYQVYNPSLGFNYSPGVNTQIRVGAGYWTADFKNDDARDEERFIVNSDISQTWDFRRGAIVLTGTSGYDESFFDADNLGLRIYYGATARINYALSRRLNADLNASYRNNDYVDTDPERTDRISTAGGGLVFILTNYLTARLDYQHRNFDSTQEEETYRENSLIFSITLKPERPVDLNR